MLAALRLRRPIKKDRKRRKLIGLVSFSNLMNIFWIFLDLGHLGLHAFDERAVFLRFQRRVIENESFEFRVRAFFEKLIVTTSLVQNPLSADYPSHGRDRNTPQTGAPILLVQNVAHFFRTRNRTRHFTRL